MDITNDTYYEEPDYEAISKQREYDSDKADYIADQKSDEYYNK